ncbi:hypothetical protein [Gimesia aquarii]|uniref:Uncharacterized protein n=1 Tax=Gimesia aquarii TaxID=2527964 RepID=A0A517WWN2_9PLAN|nr:hypothetical protein [Gimesia aquarii]QDU09619.1 hypothetical protein V202x_29950 [Gimesia aquarii]
MILTNATVKGNPFTPLNWRWEIAEQLFSEPDLDEIPEHQVTRDALTYLKTGDRLKFPEIHTSHQIFQEDGLRRAELEARILVGQSDSKIAGFCNLTPAVVQVFADLFFCVRDFPGTSDWKLIKTVGKPHFRGYCNHNLRQMWNWFGLTGQSEVLNWVIQSYYDEFKPDDEPTLSVYLRPTSSVDLGLQALIAELAAPIFHRNNRWEEEFMFYTLSIKLLATQEEKDRALQQYKKDRVKYVYQSLTGQIKSQPPRRKVDKTASGSPERLIKKIQKKLRSLELSAS